MSKELIVVQNEMFYDGQILVHAAEGTERIQTPGLNLSNPEWGRWATSHHVGSSSKVGSEHGV